MLSRNELRYVCIVKTPQQQNYKPCISKKDLMTSYYNGFPQIIVKKKKIISVQLELAKILIFTIRTYIFTAKLKFIFDLFWCTQMGTQLVSSITFVDVYSNGYTLC